MRRILMILFIGLILLLSNGCGICKKVQYVPIETTKDSIYVETLVRDTVRFEIPGDTVRVVAQDSSRLETKYSVSEAVIDSVGRLHHSLINKDIKIEKEIVYKEIEKRVEVEKEVPVEVEIPVKYVPGYYKWINIIFWSIIVIVVIFIVLKVYFEFKS